MLASFIQRAVMQGIPLLFGSTGEIMQKKFSSGSSMFAEGFVTASLVFCIGSMAILGSLRDGIYHDPTILITKGMIDGVMSVIFASTLGGEVVILLDAGEGADADALAVDALCVFKVRRLHLDKMSHQVLCAGSGS